MTETKRDWGDPEVTVARIAFRRGERAWEAYDDNSYDHQASEGPRTTATPPRMRTTWSACFDGRRLGTVATVPAPDMNAIALAGVHQLAPGQRAPFTHGKSKAFSGWMHMEVHHPIVLSTADSCDDPEHWKRAVWPPDLLTRVFPQLRKAVAGISGCDKNGAAAGPYEFGPEDVVLGDAYLSNRGDRIVTASIRQKKEVVGTCDMLDEPWSPQTFAVLAGGTVRYLGSSMQVLDAGDYDGDGHSEVLFQFAGYDYDGYTLFWNDFKDKVTYGWIYH